MSSLALQAPISSIYYHSLPLLPETHSPILPLINLTLPQVSAEQCAILSSIKFIESNSLSAEWTLAQAVSRATVDLLSPIKTSLQSSITTQSAEILSSLTFYPVTFAVKSSLLSLAYCQHLRMEHNTAPIRQVLLGLAAINTIHTSFLSLDSSASFFKLGLAGLLITLKAYAIIK